MSPEIDEAIVLARRAAGVVAARRRGDHDGAELLMQEFDAAADPALGFYLVADLALVLLSRATGRSVEDCVNDVALALAAGGEPGGPKAG